MRIVCILTWSTINLWNFCSFNWIFLILIANPFKHTVLLSWTGEKLIKSINRTLGRKLSVCTWDSCNSYVFWKRPRFFPLINYASTILNLIRFKCQSGYYSWMKCKWKRKATEACEKKSHSDAQSPIESP